MIEFAEGIEAGSVLAGWLAEPMRATAPLWLWVGGELVLGFAPASEIPPRDPSLPPTAFERPAIINHLVAQAFIQRQHDIDHGYEQHERNVFNHGELVRRCWIVRDARGQALRSVLIDDDFGPVSRLWEWPKKPKPTTLDAEGKRVLWAPFAPDAHGGQPAGGDCDLFFSRQKIYQNR